jgi:hypothetical protein
MSLACYAGVDVGAAPVRITKGLLCGLSGLYAGMRGQERVAVLLSALGKVELAKGDIEAV